MRSELGPPSAANSGAPDAHATRRAARRAAGLAALAALAAQAWMLRLPFQNDDYNLLGNPAGLFALARDVAPEDNLGLEGTMMRWTLWATWALVRLPLDAPLAAWPFHAVGWLAHALVAALVAVATARLAHARVRRPARAGLAAGLLFGVGGGWVQAASWISAWGDLLMTLFGLLALIALWPAPGAAAERGSRARRAWCAAALTLALFAKEPALLAALGLGAVAIGRAIADRARRARLGADLVALAVPLVLVTLARWWYLGTPEPRYGALGTPSPAELPALLGRGAAALAQGLAPWNRDPCFSDLAPLGSACASFASGWASALLLIAVGALAARRARWPILGGCALALAWAVPTGMLFSDPGTNVQGRTLYLPMSACATAIGIALAASLEHGARVVRWTGCGAGFVLAAATLDGSVHVARTELAAASDVLRQRAALTASLRAPDDAGRPPNVLVLRPEFGMGGIPTIGGLLGESFEPPFDDPLPDSVGFALTLAELWEDLPFRVDPRRDLWILAPAATPRAPATSSGRALRDARVLGPLGARMPARAEGLGAALLAAGPLAATSPHALAQLAVVLGPGAAGDGVLRFERAGGAPPIDLALSWAESAAARRLPLVLTGDQELWLGPPVVGLAWLAPHAPDFLGVELAERAPSIGAVGPRHAAVALGELPPECAVAPDPALDWPRSARLELKLLGGTFHVSLVGDGRFEATGAADPWRFTATHLREAGAPAPGGTWSEFVTQILRPGLLARQRRAAAADWRLVFTYPGGALAGASPWTRITLRL